MHIRQGLYLELHPASWSITVIGPLVRVNICGIVTSPWTCHQSSHLGSRSDCQAIVTTDRTPPWTSSLMHRVHFFFFTSTPSFDPPMLLQIDVIPGWWCVRYTLMSRPHVLITVRPSHLWVLFLKSWIVCIPHAWCTVHETTPLNGCSEVEETSVTTMV
jgi:hypothetical protein